jgi:hypothetical protein
LIGVPAISAGTEINEPMPGYVQPANERFVSLAFDDLQPGTILNNLYPDIKFSSPAGNVLVYRGSSFESAPSSPPNVISPAVPSAPIIMNFTQPVNNLVFSIVGEDDYGTIGGLNYCQNINGGTTCSQAQPISGSGAFGNYYPLVFDFGRVGINNVTQVTVVPVSSDPDGLAYDDISFTVPITQPPPTPTVSPTPTPPAAPTDLKGTPDEKLIELSWTPTQGTTTYVIERCDAPPISGSAASTDSPCFTPISTISCFTSPCLYPDTGLDSDFTYTYAVQAVGVSGLSNQVKLSPCRSQRAMPNRNRLRPTARSRIHMGGK